MSATTVPFFTPTQISGCSLWLDAADTSTLSLSGTTVTQWRDKSTGGNNTTILGTPLYASSPYRYVGTRNMTQNLTVSSAAYTVTASQPGCLFFIYADTQTQGTDFAALFGSSDPFNYFNQSLIRPDAYAYSFSSTLPNASVVAVLNTKNLVLYCIQYTHGSSSMLLRLNGTSLVTTNISALVPSGSLVLSGTGWGGKGNINLCEALSFKSLLNLSQIQQVEGYLAWKWGLQANLPSNHPYKTSIIPPLSNPPTSLPSITQSLQPITWFPSQVSGLSIWLDAADASSMTLSGSNVTLWRDKSGKGKNATTNSPVGPTLTTTPEFMNTSLYFNSSNYMLIPNNTLVNANGIFFVVFQEDTGQTSQKFVIQNYKAFGIQEFQYDTQSTTIASGSFYTASFASRITSFSITAAEVLQTTGKLNSYTNGSLTQSVTVATSSATGDTDDGTNIGRYTFNNNEGYVGRFKGYLAEILYFNTSLTVARRQEIEGYLAWKWGLQAKLPVTHPYKLSPPFVPAAAFPARSLARAVGWQPTQISGLSLWLDAADTSTLSLSGTSVTQWADKSGNGYNLSQANASLQPAFVSNQLNGFGGVQPSSGKYLALVGTSMPNFAYGNQTSVFCVARNAANNSSWNIFATMFFTTIPSETSKSRWHLSFNQGVTAGFTLVFTNSPQTTYQNTSFVTQPSASAILGFTGSSSETLLAYNGLTSSYAGRTLQNADDGIVMAIAEPRSNGPVGGTVFEFVGLNRAITTAERQQVEGYLAWKWGLQGTLPANHPYKKWPPSP